MQSSEPLGERGHGAQSTTSEMVYFHTQDSLSGQHAVEVLGCGSSNADLRTAPHRQKGPRFPEPRAQGALTTSLPDAPPLPSGARRGPDTFQCVTCDVRKVCPLWVRTPPNLISLTAF